MQTADSHCDPGSWNYMYAISFIILQLDAANYSAVSLPHKFNNLHPTYYKGSSNTGRYILETTTTASTTTARRKHG